MAKNVDKIGSNIQLGMLIFSLQDVAVKWIGGDYPVLEIVCVGYFLHPLVLDFIDSSIQLYCHTDDGVGR